MEIFTRKTERDMRKVRNSLMGNWFIILNNEKIDLSFSDNNGHLWKLSF